MGVLLTPPDGAARNTWRIAYYVKIKSSLVKKAKYAKAKADANLLKRQLERVEDATRTGLATGKEIEDWIARGWIKEEEAAIAFTGYAETAERKRKELHYLRISDYRLQRQIGLVFQKTDHLPKVVSEMIRLMKQLKQNVV